MLATTTAVAAVPSSVTRNIEYDGEFFEYYVSRVVITVTQGTQWKFNDTLVTLDSGIGLAGRFSSLLSNTITRQGGGVLDGRNHADIANENTGRAVSTWQKAQEYPTGLNGVNR
jgi:hypothetical protein